MLSVYFGERARLGGRAQADVLLDAFARHRVRAGITMRGIEGFGLTHQIRTDRTLSLSEDLPLVCTAFDREDRITTLLHELEALRPSGLVTLERANLAGGDLGAAEVLGTPGGEARLTVLLGRRRRAGGGPAHEAVVALLRERGVAGAAVLLGVDGTVRGTRRRARFLGPNLDVPAAVVSVGDRAIIGALLPALAGLVPTAVVTLERVRVCKRDGATLAEPLSVAGTDPTGLDRWHRITVYASEASVGGGAPLHGELVRRLRAARAAGVTTLRGAWGFHGDHEPHGDSFRQLRRRVPVVCVAIDTPEAVDRWYGVVDELTAETGLVTSEVVPAYRARVGPHQRGGLRLARPG